MENSIILKQLDSEKLTEIIKESLRAVITDVIPASSECKTSLISRAEASKFLKISLPTLHEYTKQGILVGYRIGGRVLYKQSEIEEVLEQNSTAKYRGANHEIP